MTVASFRWKVGPNLRQKWFFSPKEIWIFFPLNQGNLLVSGQVSHFLGLLVKKRGADPDPLWLQPVMCTILILYNTMVSSKLPSLNHIIIM